MTLRSDSFIPLLRCNDASLFELSFSGKYPTGATLRLIGDALKKNTQLKRLDLAGCNLKDEDVCPFLSLLTDNAGLTHLDLQNNPELSDVTGKALLECVLGKNDSLSFVALGGTALTPGLIDDVQFVMALNKFPKQLKPQAYRARINDQTFFTFELTHDPSDVKVYNEESARMIAHSLMHNTVVRSLKLNRCCVGDHSFRELRSLLQSNTTLCRLSLQSNYLGSESAILLATALERAGDATAIVDIDLSLNEVDDEGCDRLTELLKTNTSIRVVTLIGNRCSQISLDRLRTGCALNCEPAELKPMLPRLVANDPSIVKIELPGTADVSLRGPGRGYFTSLGAATIAEALLYNTVVHTVTLSGNHIGPDGAKALASLIAKTKTLTSLNVSGNPIQDEGARHLITALRQNDSIVELDVSQCHCSSKSLKEIAALCHINAQPLPIKELLGSKAPLTGVVDLSYRPHQPLGKWKSLHAESMPYVVTILTKHRGIDELNLSDNMTLGDAGVAHLVPVLRDAACLLRKLYLCNTSLTDESLKALYDAVRVNYNIRSIIVSPNPSSTTKAQQRLDDAVQLNRFPPAVKDIIPALLGNVDGVEAVVFAREEGESPFGDDAVRVLCHALRENTKVHTLAFSGHRVSNRGAGYVSELLLANNTITHVDLSVNDIGPDGISELSLMLEQNSSLRTLLLHLNPLTDIGGVTLLKSLQTANRTLTKVSVDQCKLLPQTVVHIQAQVAANGQPLYFRGYILDQLAGLSKLKFYGDVATGFLDESSIEALVLFLQCLPSCAHIHSIEFPSNKISDAGLPHLSRLASIVPNLATLDLRDNLFTKDAIPGLVELVCAAPRLTTFYCLNPSTTPCPQIDDAIAIHREAEEFQRLYSRWASALERRRRDGASHDRMTLELFDQTLTPNGMRLLLKLFASSGALPFLKGVQLLNCRSVSCSDEAGADPSRQQSVFGVLLDALKDFSLEGIRIEQSVVDDPDALVELVRATKCVVCDTGDKMHSGVSDATAETLAALVATHRGERAVQNVEALFRQPLKAAATAAKRAGKAAGSALALVRSLDEEQAVHRAIMNDALNDMPRRTPYTRGMYRVEQ